MAMAAAALLLAVVSAGLSWRALDQANDARDIAAAGAVGAQDADGRATQPTATAPQDNGPATEEPILPEDPAVTPQEPELNEQTEFKVKYSKELLRLRAECSYQMKADLDEPRVGVDSREDLIFNMACGGDTSSLVLADGVVGARVDSSTLTPADCADQIRTGALPPQGPTPARQGVVLCVKTSHAAASEQGITQKMVVLEIRGVAQDGTVTVQATAWDIPR
jgi:hypothetical protein